MTNSATISKVVILARGLGTRMRREHAGAALDDEQSAMAATGVKAMISIGRPFLDYVLSGLADVGFKQACLVIGPEHNLVQEYYMRVRPPVRMQVTFALQAEALGTANALQAAEEFSGADEFLTMNADNYYPAEALHALQRLGRPGTILFKEDALVRNSNIAAERVKEFAFAAVDGDNFLTDLIEKPGADGAANMAADRLISMNLWRFGPDIFTVCREVPTSRRGEFELPLAVMLAIQQGMKLKAATSHAGVLDLSRRSDIAAVAARLRNVEVQP